MPSIALRCSGIALGALLVSLAAPLGAQGPRSTGVDLDASSRDLSWDVAVGTLPFVDAFLVLSPPSPPWATNTASARWISFNHGATGPGGSPYTFRTQFDLTGFDPSTASLSFVCAVDNTFDAFRLNGIGMSVSCSVFAYGSTQTISTNFMPGVNTLEFVVNGDATTDGLAVDVQAFSARPTLSSVPEPATVALVAAGLLALGGAARRRGARTA